MTDNQMNDVHSKSVVFGSQYSSVASSTRVRLYDWADYLDLDVSSSYSYRGRGTNSALRLIFNPLETLRAEKSLREFELGPITAPLVISRELSPFSNGDPERRLLRLAPRGIYDFDDALYARLPGIVGGFHTRKNVWRKSVEAADVVIAGSEILAERAALFSSNVVMIPSCVNPDNYDLKRSFELQTNPIAVWLGSPSTEPYLKLAQEGLLRAHSRFGLRLKVISSGNRSLGALDSMTDRVGWTQDSVYKELSMSDFGLMPLPDNEWARGKCAYKMLQYGATGLPIIASPVGANRVAISRLSAWSAQTPSEWVERIFDMCALSSNERRNLGHAARSGVSMSYSFHAWKDSWLDAVFSTR